MSYSKFSKFDGKKPEFIVAEDFDDLVKKSTNKILKLIKEENFVGRDIAVLSDKSMRPSNNNSQMSLRNLLEENELEVISAREYALPYIRENLENNVTLTL